MSGNIIHKKFEPKKAWDKEDLEALFCGTLQAEFSELVCRYFPGVPKDEHGMVRDSDFNEWMAEGVKVFLDKLSGLKLRK